MPFKSSLKEVPFKGSLNLNFEVELIKGYISLCCYEFERNIVVHFKKSVDSFHLYFWLGLLCNLEEKHLSFNVPGIQF